MWSLTCHCQANSRPPCSRKNIFSRVIGLGKWEPCFATPLELFNKTEGFYHSVVRRRLSEEMGNVASAAQFHFREHWGIDRDIYAEAITNNIRYIKEIYEDCA